ncbi:DUF4177 domain-containing protein [Ethanoligenens sp.]|uniref:DUF4177 domain-containing protein n=1 Tax=Ethanoligenens sp. TaxID=2099655 RepID=UPI0039E8CCCB
MAQYEYRFVEIPLSPMTKQADDIKKCKEVIASDAQNGWRLKQVVVPYHERFGLFRAKGYEIIFEKENH